MQYPSGHIKKSLLLLYLLTSATAYANNCQLQLSDTVINYGRVARAEMLEKQDGPNVSFGKRQMTLTVFCQKPTEMGLAVRDIKGADKFGFGDRGQLIIQTSNARLDGNPVNLAPMQTAGGISPESSATLTIKPGTTVVPVVAGQPVKGQNFSMQVEVDAKVDEIATRVRAETTWEGKLSFELLER